MKISLNHVKQFIDFELPETNELVTRINRQLGTVENVTDLNDQYKDALIVSILNVSPHPNADRLNTVYIDDGGVTKDIQRENDGSIQVVCGAPNVHEQSWAVWLPPKSIVPSTYQDDEPFVLGARELRGILSQGMLAAPDELGIGSSHEGILLLTHEDTRYIPSGKEILAGARFAEVYGLDDTIIEIENKMFTHRPDLFGQLGIAREIAGIFAKEFKSPDWYIKVPEFEVVSSLEFEVFNEAPEYVPRFTATAMDNVQVKPSPLWLQCAVVALGSKPINNIVDITNYIMLITAQPVHAYDYDKIRGHKIGARMASNGEAITLLNGKTYNLSKDDIVIADAEGPIGLAGIMGGGNSEIDENTERIILEVGTFDMYALRKTSMRHGLFTDALTRFNKGQSPLQNNRVMNQLMTMLNDTARVRQCGKVIDLNSFKDSIVSNDAQSVNKIEVANQFITSRLGLSLKAETTTKLLQNVEFTVTYDNNNLLITKPFWRMDIDEPEDVIEEVGRLYGFDKLPRDLPIRSIEPTPKNDLFEFKSSLRATLKSFGANELLTYSFTHEKVLKNAEQNPDNAFRLSNALSPELQYYRLSLLPSLLEKSYSNLRAGHDSALVYEIGKAHDKTYQDLNQHPVEAELLELVFYSKKSIGGAAFYAMRSTIEKLLQKQHIYDASIKQVDNDDLGGNVTKLYEPSRTAKVISKNGELIGFFGELKSSVLARTKLPEHTATASLYVESLLACSSPHADYWPLSKFPSITQDVSIEVDKQRSYDDVLLAVNGEISKLDKSLQITLVPRSIYKRDDTVQNKIVTLRFVIKHEYRTLEDSEVQTILTRVSDAVQNEAIA